MFQFVVEVIRLPFSLLNSILLNRNQFFMRDTFLFREEFICSDSSSQGENYNSEEKKCGSLGKNCVPFLTVKNSHESKLIYV